MQFNQIGKKVSLTNGGLQDLFQNGQKGEQHLRMIVQILEIIFDNNKTIIQISDGDYFCSSFVASCLSDAVKSFAKYNIIKITKCIVNRIKDKTILIIKDMELVSADCTEMIGQPKNIPPYIMAPQQQLPVPDPQIFNKTQSQSAQTSRLVSPQRTNAVLLKNSPERLPVYTSIKNLNQYLPGWCLLARVVMKTQLMFFNGRNGQGKLFSVILKDKLGDEIKGTFFNAEADRFDSVISEGKIYVISGGTIKDKNAKFNTTNNDYEILFNSCTIVNDGPSDACIDNNITYNFTKIADLNIIDKNRSSLVDVVAVISRIGEISEIRVKNDKITFRRNIELFDDSLKKICLSLWDDDARNVPSMNTDDFVIVALKDAKLTNFNGISLSSPSDIRYSPTLAEASALEDWVHNNQNTFLDTSTFESLSNGFEFNNKLIYITQINDIIQKDPDESENDLNHNKNTTTNNNGSNFNSVSTFVSFYGTCTLVNAGRLLYYKACPHEKCRYKGLVENRIGQLICGSCNEIIENPVFRFNFSVILSDFSGSIEARVIGDDEVGRKIIGLTASDCERFSSNRAETEQDREVGGREMVERAISQMLFRPMKFLCQVKVTRGPGGDGGGSRDVFVVIKAAEILKPAEAAMFYIRENTKLLGK